MDKIIDKISYRMVIALGATVEIHNDIEIMYQENKWMYYQFFRNSELYEHPMIENYSTMTEKRIRQVGGIFAWCEAHHEFEKIFNLIRKGFKFVFQYANKNKTVDLDDFRLDYLAHFSKNGKEVSPLDLINAGYVLLFICEHKQIACLVENEFGNFIQQSLVMWRSDKKLFSNQDDSVVFDEYPFMKKFESMNVLNFISWIADQEVEIIQKLNPDLDEEYLRKKVRRTGITKDVDVLTNWMASFGVEYMEFLHSMVIGKEAAINLFKYALHHIPSSAKDRKNERGLIIISLLMIEGLSISYLASKRLYLNDSEEQHYLEIQKQESEFLSRQQELNETTRRLLIEKENVENRNRYLEEKLRVMEIRLQQANQKLEDQESFKKEVVSLREYMYQMQNEQVVETSRSAEQMIEELNKRKIAVFGGHPNWRNKLKETFPKFTFLDVDNANRDLSFVDNLDAVIVNYEYFNHSYYERLMMRMNQNEVKLHYITGSTNLERNIGDIYKKVVN